MARHLKRTGRAPPLNIGRGLFGTVCATASSVSVRPVARVRDSLWSHPIRPSSNERLHGKRVRHGRAEWAAELAGWRSPRAVSFGGVGRGHFDIRYVGHCDVFIDWAGRLDELNRVGAGGLFPWACWAKAQCPSRTLCRLRRGRPVHCSHGQFPARTSPCGGWCLVVPWESGRPRLGLTVCSWRSRLTPKHCVAQDS